LKSEFEHIGGVIDARVIYERENPSRSRGYGYVDFKSQKFADKAVKEMHGKEIDGREINVDISTSKPAGNAGNNDRRQGGFRGNDRGERNFSSGANSIPLGQRNSAPFSGQKKTFD